MAGPSNNYTRYLSGSRQPIPDQQQPSPIRPTGSPLFPNQFADGRRSVPSTPGGASMASMSGYMEVPSPDAYQPLDPEVAAGMTVEDMLNIPAHKTLPRLDPLRPPGTFWFDEDVAVASAIRSIFERDFKEPHANFSQVPGYVVDRWFKTFAQRYHWEPTITAQVRQLFERKLKERMRDQVGRWKKNWQKKGDAAMPQWFDKAVWDGLVRYWVDPKSEVRSATSRAARLFDPLGEGPHKHCSGQTSFKARARKIQETSGDSHRDLVEILYQTKRSVAGVIVDKRSERIFEEVTAKMQELTQGSSSDSCPLTTAQKNEIYSEVVPRKKGRLYGSGSLGSNMGSQDGFSSQASQNVHQRLAQTEDKLAQTEDKLARTEDQLAQTQAAQQQFTQMFSLLAKKDPELAAMMKALQPGCSGASSSQPQDPSPPSDQF